MAGWAPLWLCAAGALGAAGNAVAGPQAGAAVAVGAGVRGPDGVAALDLRGDLRARRFAGGLGLRLRSLGDDFARGDWDTAGDWLAVVRYLEWHTAREGCPDVPADRAACRQDGVALAAGQLASLQLAHLITSYTAMIDADGPHTGAELRVLSAETDSYAVIDDVLAPVVIGARSQWIGPRATLGAGIAADPSAPATMDEAALIAIAGDAAVRMVADPIASQLDVGASHLVGHGVGAWLGASSESRGDWGGLKLRVEGNLGTSRWVAAPFGPLYRVEREASGRGTLLERIRGGGLGGFGGEASLAIALGRWGALDGAMRYRPTLGGEVRGRASMAIGAVKLGAWMAANPKDHRWVMASELHAQWTRRYHVVVEASRLVSHDEMEGVVPIWQATAWLGVTTDE